MSRKVMIAAVAGLALAGAGVLAATGVLQGGGEAVAAENAAPTEPFAGTVTDSGGYTGDVIEGAADAPVTVIEYSSLTCPHCASFHKTFYPKLKEEFIETGKVRFIYRDYPLDNVAVAASIIARCGGEKRYLPMIDVLLTQQDKWRSADDVIGALKQYAKLAGLGGEKVDACLSDDALGQSILDRARVGQDEFQVRSTPTVIVAGEKVQLTGYDDLREAIDDQL